MLAEAPPAPPLPEPTNPFGHLLAEANGPHIAAMERAAERMRNAAQSLRETADRSDRRAAETEARIAAMRARERDLARPFAREERP
jgi:hypothetical protein